MNAISIDTRVRGGALGAAARTARIRPVGIAPSDLPMEWLPAPPIRSVSRAQHGCREAAKAKLLWVRPQAHSAAEKVFFVLLTVAAVAGIVYGVSCLIDLVQNWAALSTGIRTLI